MITMPVLKIWHILSACQIMSMLSYTASSECIHVYLLTQIAYTASCTLSKFIIKNIVSHSDRSLRDLWKRADLEINKLIKCLGCCYLDKPLRFRNVALKYNKNFISTSNSEFLLFLSSIEQQSKFNSMSIKPKVLFSNRFHVCQSHLIADHIIGIWTAHYIFFVGCIVNFN